ncbi:hypothetical protein LTR94_035868, partial [Friedmanniomyces endolithicus]
LAQRASEIVEDFASDTPRDLEYDNLGPRFAALFPPKDGDDFGSFLDLFDDPDFPSFDCSIVIIGLTLGLMPKNLRAIGPMSRVGTDSSKSSWLA